MMWTPGLWNEANMDAIEYFCEYEMRIAHSAVGPREPADSSAVLIANAFLKIFIVAVGAALRELAHLSHIAYRASHIARRTSHVPQRTYIAHPSSEIPHLPSRVSLFISSPFHAHTHTRPASSPRTNHARVARSLPPDVRNTRLKNPVLVRLTKCLPFCQVTGAQTYTGLTPNSPGGVDTPLFCLYATMILLGSIPLT
jgi:hypothetical protein